LRVHSFRLLTCLLSAAAWSNAAVIHDNGAPDRVTGNNLAEFIQVDDFVVSAPSTLLSVRFWTLQSTASDYAGSIEWIIYGNSGGQPGAQIANGNIVATQVVTGLGNAGLGLLEFQYDFTISLPINTGTYWLGLHNGLLNATAPVDIYWGSSASGGGNAAGEFDLVLGGPFTQNGVEKAFIVFGDGNATIPEPGSVVLLSLGLGALVALRRRV
jgi:hypothetical protein